TCLAGSFTWGGHNPVEPAQLGCAIIVGPRMDNFAVMADDLLGAGAALQVMDEAELTETLSHLLKTPQECAALGIKARNWTATKSGVLDETLRLLEPFFTKAESSP
ncbi:MAG: 3-deoxy-D-manno-octulosonic acid transferase, partial [Alphaproteobacteria bacterium]|nr:3-deoxy-D-manno-octulosonic acid transferase [Alphaproteobacteria bacterium]